MPNILISPLCHRQCSVSIKIHTHNTCGKTAPIYSLLLVRWLSLQRLTPLLSTPAPDSASATSRPQLLPILCRIKQLLQSRHRLPIQQQPADEAPPTFCLAHPECHPHSQPEHGHAGAKPTVFDIARHDAAAGVHPPLVAAEPQDPEPSALRLIIESFCCIIASHGGRPTLFDTHGLLFCAVSSFLTTNLIPFHPLWTTFGSAAWTNIPCFEYGVSSDLAIEM